MILQILAFTPSVPLCDILDVYQKYDQIQKVYDHFNPPSQSGPIPTSEEESLSIEEKKMYVWICINSFINYINYKATLFVLYVVARTFLMLPLQADLDDIDTVKACKVT